MEQGPSTAAAPTYLPPAGLDRLPPRLAQLANDGIAGADRLVVDEVTGIVGRYRVTPACPCTPNTK